MSLQIMQLSHLIYYANERGALRLGLLPAEVHANTFKSDNLYLFYFFCLASECCFFFLFLCHFSGVFLFTNTQQFILAPSWRHGS